MNPSFSVCSHPGLQAARQIPPGDQGGEEAAPQGARTGQGRRQGGRAYQACTRRQVRHQHRHHPRYVHCQRVLFLFAGLWIRITLRIRIPLTL